jgi:flagellar L-ring protein precursor FlgH
MNKIGLWVLIMFGGVVVLGCGAHTKKATAPVEVSRPHVATPAPQEQSSEGSLWRSDSAMASLFSDIKARRVGDIVTISIVESSSASESANTDTSRDSSVFAGVDSFLGYEKHLAELYPNFDMGNMLDATLRNEFEGTGKTVRSGKLTASITARIIEVLPNGNFVIEGRREVEVNHETHYIVISGIVRPKDISPDNIVLSTFISDARIAYSGKGVIDDYQYPGWFTRILNKAWPF